MTPAVLLRRPTARDPIPMNWSTRSARLAEPPRSRIPLLRGAGPVACRPCVSRAWCTARRRAQRPFAARFLGTRLLIAADGRRIGYDPVLSRIRFNSGCGNTFDQRIVRTVIREHARSGRRLAVIGHSRGGHYARSLATRHPDLISHIVTLGSAVEDPLDVSMLTKRAAAAVRVLATTHNREKQQSGCLTLGCTCEFSRGFAQPFPAQVRFTSIHSRNDGVVHWGSCIADYAICVEVTGSHVGLAFNRHAYRAVARALAGR